MNLISKGVVGLTLLSAAAMSSATLSYSNIDATITFDGTHTFDLTVNHYGNTIDFTAGSLPMYVDSVSSTYKSAVINISYDVNSQKSINGLGLIFTGFTLGQGNIGYSETVTGAGNVVLASVSGNKSGNNPFVESDFLNFGSGQTAYSVDKQFTLNLSQISGHAPGETNPGASLASIGLIEQNAVPEPASLGAVGVGLLGLLTRRRRK